MEDIFLLCEMFTYTRSEFSNKSLLDLYLQWNLVLHIELMPPYATRLLGETDSLFNNNNFIVLRMEISLVLSRVHKT